MSEEAGSLRADCLSGSRSLVNAGIGHMQGIAGRGSSLAQGKCGAASGHDMDAPPGGSRRNLSSPPCFV
jgi:hypothetical protein